MVLTNSGFLQLTGRIVPMYSRTQYRTSDSVDDLIRPLIYLTGNDICGKTLDSCKTRYGHRPEVGGSLITVQAAINATWNTTNRVRLY